MAVEKLYDGHIWLAQFNLSGYSNQVDVSYEAEALDGTVFGSETRLNYSGLKSWSMNASGFWEAGVTPGTTIDPNVFNMIGAAAIPLTVAPKSTEGTTAFLMKAIQPSFNFFGQLGELTPFSLSCSPSNYGTRGFVSIAATSRAASANGSNSELGALSSTQRLAATLHVSAFTGTSLDVVIESDDNSGFTTPTTRLTFTQATGLTSEWKDAAGPITDTYFRAKCTFVGTSFTALVAVGIHTP